MEQGRQIYTVMRLAGTWTIVAAVAIVVGAGIYSVRLIQYGFSAKEKPTLPEAFLVRRCDVGQFPQKRSISRIMPESLDDFVGPSAQN